MNDALLLAGSLATRLSVEQPERRLLMRLLAATCLSLPIVASLAQALPEDVPGAVRGALANWIAAFNRGDPTGVYFASDAVMVRGNGTFNGATVINDMEQRESKAGLRLTLVVDHVQILNSTTALAVRRYTVMPPGAPGSPRRAQLVSLTRARLVSPWSLRKMPAMIFRAAHHLCVIFAADVAGFITLMRCGEKGTLAPPVSVRQTLPRSSGSPDAGRDQIGTPVCPRLAFRNSREVG